LCGYFTLSTVSKTWGDVLLGLFVYDLDMNPTTGDRSTVSHFDSATQVVSAAPQSFGHLTIKRTTVKATVSHYRAGLFGGDHELKAGAQLEKAGHQSITVIPTG